MNASYLVGAASSVMFGAADFTGGMAAKRAPAPLVTCFSGLGALLVLFVRMPFTHGSPTPADLLARIVLGERWTLLQNAGFALAVIAAGCITLG